MNRSLSRITESRPFAIFVALLMISLIGYVDFRTGYAVSIFVVYAIPIMLVVWQVDSRHGILIAAICALVWWIADWRSGHPYFTNWGQIWEATVRFTFFVFVVIGGRAMKLNRDAIENELRALSRTRELEREIVGASEREQQRIGQDLHDGLCQYLAAIGCAAGALKDDLDEKFAPEATAAGEIEELLREAVVQARNVARGIAPVHMDEAGLPSALRELAESTARLTSVDCEFTGEHAASFRDQQTATHLFRIAQEATNNAVKHAHATRLDIRLRRDGPSLVVEVADNGIGLSDRHESTGGMGMKTMQYRSRLIGAELEIASDRNGTRVFCRIPEAALAAAQPLFSRG